MWTFSFQWLHSCVWQFVALFIWHRNYFTWMYNQTGHYAIWMCPIQPYFSRMGWMSKQVSQLKTLLLSPLQPLLRHNGVQSYKSASFSVKLHPFWYSGRTAAFQRNGNRCAFPWAVVVLLRITWCDDGLTFWLNKAQTSKHGLLLCLWVPILLFRNGGCAHVTPQPKPGSSKPWGVIC